MGRPKGSKNVTLNQSKYWLPENITLKIGQKVLSKADKYTFIDSIYGEFISSYRLLQNANRSLHPRFQSLQKSLNNPGATPEATRKRQNTMLERYGVKNALENPEILLKMKNTVITNYGVEHPMLSQEVRDTLRATNISKFGSPSPFGNKNVIQKSKNTLFSNYGVSNPAKSPEIQDKIFQSQLQNNTNRTSKFEKDIAKYVTYLGHRCRTIRMPGSGPREIDVFIDELNIGIEANGAYFHSEHSGTDKNYHLDKLKKAQTQNIQLIQIFDYEWKERKYQVQSFLRSKLKKNNVKIHARKCELVLVDSHTANDFLDTYHILGKMWSTYYIGLKYKDELVALVAMGTHHRHKNQILLKRYITKTNVTIMGGLSKLCKKAKELYPNDEIYTFIDLRWSDGQNWLKCGWELVSQNKPTYSYYNLSTRKVVTQQAMSRRKNIKNKQISEKEYVDKANFTKIWDCGKLKLRYIGRTRTK